MRLFLNPILSQIIIEPSTPAYFKPVWTEVAHQKGRKIAALARHSGRVDGNDFGCQRSCPTNQHRKDRRLDQAGGSVRLGALQPLGRGQVGDIQIPFGLPALRFHQCPGQVLLGIDAE